MPAAAATAAADARADRAVALSLMALAASSALSWGTPTAVAISLTWAAVSGACAAATAAPWYRGRARVLAAVLPRLMFPVFVQLFVASGRRGAVRVSSVPMFWASRVGPYAMFLYGVTARLPRPLLRGVLAVQAVVLAALQPTACVAIEACYIGINAVMARMAAAGAAATGHVISAVAGAAPGPHLAPTPCPARTCVLMMTWLYWSALLAVDVFAHGDSRAPLHRAAPRAAVRAAAAFAALLAADALLPCVTLGVVGGSVDLQCTRVVAGPPLKRLLPGWGRGAG